jgi:hypothetical protein
VYYAPPPTYHAFAPPIPEVLAPGKTLILVAAITLMVFSSIAVLYNILELATIGSWLPDYGGPRMRIPWILHHGVGILLPVFGLVMCIMGVLRCRKLDGSKLLMILPLVYIGGAIAHLVIKMATGTVTAGVSPDFVRLNELTTLMLFPLWILAPLLFMFGAIKNMNEAKRAAAREAKSKVAAAEAASKAAAAEFERESAAEIEVNREEIQNESTFS